MKRYIILLLLALLLAGCTKETVIDNGGTSELQATLTLRVTGNTTTRALTADDENEIEEIDVLVFSKANASDPNPTAGFFYRAETVRIITDSGDSAEKNFRITLKKSDDYQRLVVFANCRAAIDAIEAAQGAGGFSGMNYTAVMAALTMTNTSAWNSTTGTYDALPMWGQNDFKVFTNAAAAASTIQLYRSLARVDVVVGTGAQGDFKLNGVWLYNPSTKGLLAPSAGNWSGTEATDESLPSGGRAASSTPFPYTTMTTTHTALQGVIYTFEAPAATSRTASGETCLVVRGSWNNEADSYYRIDFHNGTDFLPLLRNFHYNVSINAVSGRGYGSPAEAIAAGFTSLTATTQIWNEGDMGSVVWDGSRYLAVSTNEHTVYPEAQAVTVITAATNYVDTDGSTGWKASLKVNDSDNAVTNVDWITIDSGSATGVGNNAAKTIAMTVLQNTVGKDRTATLTVTAGRLIQTITITQKYQGLLSLDVGDVEVVFSSANPQKFTLPIDWEPAANSVTLELIHAGTPAASAYSQLTGYTAGLSFSGANTLAAAPTTLVDTDGNAHNGGSANLDMLPDDDQSLAQFAERRSILKVTSTATDGRTESKTVLLRQFDYAIAITGTSSSYQLETTYSVTLKANGEWALDDSNKGQLTNISATSGEPNTSGVTFSFKTGGTENVTNKLTFYLKNDPTIKAELSVTHYRMAPNCYIVNPGSSVTIPVRKVYETWKNDVDLNGSRAGDASAMAAGSTYTTGLVWQDAVGLLNSGVGNIGTLSGSGENATFTVTATAGLEGNAVVYLAENGIIRWSWHIWVLNSNNDPTTGTAYTNPSSGITLMDRNLGATTNFAPTSIGDVRSLGLLYQWGRKDPFPGAGATNSSTSYAPIYNNGALTEGGTGVKRLMVSELRNLDNAIKNPLTFYYGTTTGTSYQWWYSTEYIQTIPAPGFWGLNEDKAIYDPCPDGWRVPPYTETASAMKNVVYEPANDYTANSGVHLYHSQGNYMGFFPLPGYRMTGSGDLANVGTVFQLWNNSRGSYCTLTNTSLAPTNGSAMFSWGVSVRCVKIQ